MSEDRGHASLSEKIYDKIPEFQSSSSSSDSDSNEPSLRKGRKKRLLGRQEPVHTVLGGGNFADIILWRNKHISGGILTGVTMIWFLFELSGYHLLTFVCHWLILFLALSFLWSNAASLLNRNPLKFPEVILSEELFLTVAQAVRFQINEAFATFRFVASGKDLKKFLMAIGGLWILSIISNWFSFLTLFSICCAITFTLPALYERYEDDVDAAAEKAMTQIKRQYAVFDVKIIQKIPRGPFSDKKRR